MDRVVLEALPSVESALIKVFLRIFKESGSRFLRKRTDYMLYTGAERPSETCVGGRKPKRVPAATPFSDIDYTL
jgi:hypothetical protein